MSQVTRLHDSTSSDRHACERVCHGHTKGMAAV